MCLNELLLDVRAFCNRVICWLNSSVIGLARSTIRDKIIPHAVSWFTGEAIQDDDIDMDDDDDDDEIDEDEEDDDEDEEEDDEDDDEDEGQAKKKVSFSV